MVKWVAESCVHFACLAIPFVYFFSVCIHLIFVITFSKTSEKLIAKSLRLVC